MNLDLRNNIESNTSTPDKRLIELFAEINSKYLIKWDLLTKLLDFKKEIQKDEAISASLDYQKDLFEEIKSQAEKWEISHINSQEELSQEELRALSHKIIEIQKLKTEIQNWLNELRVELNKASIVFSPQNMLTSSWYSKETLERIENPRSLKDNLYWWAIALIETWAIFWKLAYDWVKWVIFSIKDLANLIKWNAKYDWIDV